MMVNRRRQNLSSRDVARRAGISQAYVVRLERASLPGVQLRPTPTVDVLARLAEALLLDPAELMVGTLRRAGRHVLLVTDGCTRNPLAHARTAIGAPVDMWLSASSDPRLQPPAGPGHRLIDLRRGAPGVYDPQVIADSVRQELCNIADDLNGQRLGMIFPEVSHVMRTLDAPAVVIEFERRWADVVSTAASAVGAHAAWNVCVYDIDALRALTEPVESAMDLMHSHDTVWSAKGDRVVVGAPAARRVIGSLRPVGQSMSSWRTTTARLIDELGTVA